MKRGRRRRWKRNHNLRQRSHVLQSVPVGHIHWVDRGVCCVSLTTGRNVCQ